LRRHRIEPGPVLVVADRSVANQCLLDPLLEGLVAAGFATHIFDGIEGEPDDDVAMRCADEARLVKAVVVVGIGGGSAMDVAKMASLLATNEGEIADWLGAVTPPVAPLTLVLIPTTTGTGSEATRIAMVSVAGAKRAVSCSDFVPMIAVLDTDLVANLPSEVVASTGMDALAHAVESMLSNNRNAFTLSVATGAVALLTTHLKDAVAGDTSARASVLYGAHLAGLALNAGVVVGHSLAYVIARHSSISHGASCALALPYCLAYNDGVEPDVAAIISRAVTGEHQINLQAVAGRIAELAASVAQPASLMAVGIRNTDLALMAKEVVDEYPRPNNPVELEINAIEQLFERMLDGELSSCWTDLKVKGSESRDI
jgi:alcohol dehydrogenase class IV